MRHTYCRRSKDCLLSPFVSPYILTILILPSPLQGFHGLVDWHRRLQRHAAYLLQALLGPGAAGTPSPVPNPNAASLVGDVKASALAKAWAGITAEDGNPAFQTTQMRFLAAAAR